MALVVFAALIATFAGFPALELVAHDFELPTLISILGPAFVAWVPVERVIEVVVSPWREPGKEDLQSVLYQRYSEIASSRADAPDIERPKADSQLSGLQERARASGVGLWSDAAFVAPCVWRRDLEHRCKSRCLERPETVETSRACSAGLSRIVGSVSWLLADIENADRSAQF